MIFSRLSKLNGREQAGLAAAGLFFLAFAVDGAVVQPMIRRHAVLRAEIEAADRDILYARAVLRRERDVAARFERVGRTLSEAADPSADLDALKGRVDDLAKQAGIVLLSMKHREPRTGRGAVEYVVEIDGFEGSMSGLLSFLDAVGRGDRPGLMRVTSLRIGQGRGEKTIKGSMAITQLGLAPGESRDRG